MIPIAKPPFFEDAGARPEALAISGARALAVLGDLIEAFDEAMRLGYNWKKGPFELIDEIGTALEATAARTMQSATCESCETTVSSRWPPTMSP